MTMGGIESVTDKFYAEPCPCSRECKCPNDGRLIYKRDEGYDSTAIMGTLSSYCFAFFKRELHVSVRQYSCYCLWYSMDQWDKCVDVDTVRYDVNNPVRTLDAGYKVWRDQGWRQVQLYVKSPVDPVTTRAADQSVEVAREYVKKLSIGSTIAFLTKTGGNNDFWLASKQSDIRKSSKNDEATGVKKGEDILSIVWYDRMSDLKYSKTDYETIVSVSSVLVTVSNITWHRVTTNRYYLSETCHEKLTDIVNSGSEI